MAYASSRTYCFKAMHLSEDHPGDVLLASCETVQHFLFLLSLYNFLNFWGPVSAIKLEYPTWCFVQSLLMLRIECFASV